MKTRIKMTNWEKMKAKASRGYCDKTGSMYFDYTDASNELIDAYEDAIDWTLENAPIDILKEKNPHVKRIVEALKKITKSDGKAGVEDSELIARTTLAEIGGDE